MLLCDKCGNNTSVDDSDVHVTKYEFNSNDENVFTLHADFCLKCRKKIEKRVIKQMDIELKS